MSYNLKREKISRWYEMVSCFLKIMVWFNFMDNSLCQKFFNLAIIIVTNRRRQFKLISRIDLIKILKFRRLTGINKIRNHYWWQTQHWTDENKINFRKFSFYLIQRKRWTSLNNQSICFSIYTSKQKNQFGLTWKTVRIRCTNNAI